MTGSVRPLFAALLGVALLLGAAAPVAAALPPGGSFIDDNGMEFEGAIEAIAAEGVTGGCGFGRFCPTEPVLREQMAAFLRRALGLTETSGIRFTDVPSGHPFRADIDALATAGITGGCGSGRFCPSARITRAQMAAFLRRALHLTDQSGITFSDVPATHPFRGDIDALATAGITGGCGGGRFCPSAPVTRGQMAAFLQRALGLAALPVPPPATGNPTGHHPIPRYAGVQPTSGPDRVVGNGTPASCTSAAVVNAVALGGIITFDCGPDPITIPMSATARVFNNRPDIVLDGGGLVTLDGQGARRILYMNTCDPDLVWTTSHCQNQDHPFVVVQNIGLVNGRASGSGTMDGGGAVFARGGSIRFVNTRFEGNRCAATGPDVGGAAIQVFSQFENLPVFLVNSTIGGAGALGNACSNGGGIASIGVSWTIINSLLIGNDAIGSGANPPAPGTPGGGNGGAIYNDGNAMTLRVQGTRIEGNTSNGEGGSAIFFVSNDRSGIVEVTDSVIRNNTGDGFETHPSIFFLGSRISFVRSVVQ